MGVVVLEERPFTVTRADGLPVWIYQFKISPQQSIREEHDAAEREATAMRFADAVTAIWHGRVEIDRFNELVLRAGLTWQQVTVLRSYAKYLRQAGFPYSQSHIETVVNDNAGTRHASLVELFEALFDPDDAQSSRHEARRVGRGRRRRRRHRRAGQPRHRPGAAGVRLDDPGDAAHQLLRHQPGLGARARTCCRSR